MSSPASKLSMMTTAPYWEVGGSVVCSLFWIRWSWQSKKASEKASGPALSWQGSSSLLRAPWGLWEDRSQGNLATSSWSVKQRRWKFMQAKGQKIKGKSKVSCQEVCSLKQLRRTGHAPTWRRLYSSFTCGLCSRFSRSSQVLELVLV